MAQFVDFKTPIGFLRVTERDGAIVSVELCAPADALPMEPATELLAAAKTQIVEYFSGTRRAFSLPIRQTGTPFQTAVWAALETIPYGQTRSYGEIALQIGQPRAARAVGMANNRNRLLLLVPCHRVIGADGSLVGYGAGGIENKRILLELEQAHQAQ